MDRSIFDCMRVTLLSRDKLKELFFNGRVNIVDILVEMKIASSKSDARQLIKSNGVSREKGEVLNFEKITSLDEFITYDDFIQDRILFLKGKKDHSVLKL